LTSPKIDKWVLGSLLKAFKKEKFFTQNSSRGKQLF